MKEFRINMSDEPGSLAELCETIASKDVNILTIVAISGEFASAAILTDNADATSVALDEMGAEYSVADQVESQAGLTGRLHQRDG